MRLDDIGYTRDGKPWYMNIVFNTLTSWKVMTFPQNFDNLCLYKAQNKNYKFPRCFENANLLNRLAMWNQSDCLITELTIPMQCINLDKSLIQSPVSKGIVSK